jgi:predicted nucleic acid-binding protein
MCRIDHSAPWVNVQQVDSAQYELTQRGQHRSVGAVDLLVCATAVHHGHTVLHADNDFTTVATVLKEARQRDARA